MLEIDSIKNVQGGYSIVKKQRVTGNMRKNEYRLLESISVKLTNGDVVDIPEGFVWDLSTVPPFLWGLLPPDGFFELGSLIHDYLYENKNSLPYTQKFVDNEMLKWSLALIDRERFSLRHVDIYTRYIFIRLFGWTVWKGYLKIK